MLFTPQKYKIKDQPEVPFIDKQEILDLLEEFSNPTTEQVEEVINHSLSLNRLSMQQVAVLLNSCTDYNHRKLITNAAKNLKKEVYGERIVIFAPLYVGNYCINNCSYCGFKISNKQAVRKSLSDVELQQEVSELEKEGQKRLILVYGEHPKYSPEYIAHTVKLVYNQHSKSEGSDRINRVNINAAPLDTDGFRVVKESGIGTYQIFQETYDTEVYERFHLSGQKRDFNYRLTAMDRAMEAGIDDVGLGVLFGLGEWKFDVMALIRHTNHLEACYNVGPHTISFPRIKQASNNKNLELQSVSDDDFKMLIAILRLAVPYTGLILTAREPIALRNKLIEFGISQIDAGTKLEIGGYSDKNEEQDIDKEQFELGDNRTLEQTISELIEQGQIPSFCTACYRKGRTGEHFMEFSTKGFIKRFCTPNALLTFAEYIERYATQETKERGWLLIESKLNAFDEKLRDDMVSKLNSIRDGQSDLLL